METRYAIHPQDAKSYDTARLRKEFHSASLMVNDAVRMVYTHYDRFVYGGICPVKQPLTLPNYDALKSDYFLERRELGIINVGGSGTVTVDGQKYALNNLDMLYVGKGSKEVVFASDDAAKGARYYINSAPAHAEYPTTKATKEEANRVELGSQETANHRLLYQFIHENGIQSCQLVMGYTELVSGNIWNTFPPHTHERRMEVYFYFDLPEDQIVVHFMGQPQETRHIIMQNEEAVISPPWSIHSGAGTFAYKFVWGMAGENKSFSDMDGVPLVEVR
jgi:4-deoxy-L-threo-5-hexosulose-uronate ketol-isomerase